MRRFIAAGMGVGLLPRRLWGSDNGAGTFGAALAAVAALVLQLGPLWLHIAATAAVVALSLWAAAPYARDGQDPPWVAIDEVAGTLVALTALSGPAWVVAWLVARAADIWKVLPGVAQAEKLPGTAGVTADDVVAGIYGLVAGGLVTAIL